MYYQNYEDYMRAVLGYAGNSRNYTYDDYYPNQPIEQPNVENLYPQIYKIINPVVDDVCNRHRNLPITEELVKTITEEVYATVEKSSTAQVNVPIKTELKNGDVRNPNAKPISETRQRNFLLSDLIRILVIKKLLRNRTPIRPTYQNPRISYMEDDNVQYGSRIPIL